MCFVTGFRCSLCRRLLRSSEAVVPMEAHLFECFVVWLETCNGLCTSWSLTLGPIPTWVEVRALHRQGERSTKMRPQPRTIGLWLSHAHRFTRLQLQSDLSLSPHSSSSFVLRPPLLRLPTSHPWPPDFSLPAAVWLYLQPRHQQRSGPTEPRSLPQSAESSPQASQTKEMWQFIPSTMTTQQLTTNANLLCAITSKSWGCSL